ncbi:MAG: transglycosylase family protein [Acidimicrobiales bacterium]|nr:transglycosylase family protein [Acidimicrobiales bacterium]
MSHAPRSARPRHMAGAGHHAERSSRWRGRRDTSPVADFDVEAAFSPDFDFDALFAADDTPLVEDAPQARLRRTRVAFAISVTLAALPLLVLDNFMATADTPPTEVGTTAAAGDDAAAERPPRRALRSPAAVTVASITTMAPATTVAPPVTEAPTTTTTAAPTTTTTAKPKPVAPKPTPTTTTTAAPAVAPAREPSRSPDPSSDATWDQLAECETGGNWAANTGNGYYGGLQFSEATWHGVGGTGLPHEHSRSTQIDKAKQLHAKRGWAPWPGCSQRLGWT